MSSFSDKIGNVVVKRKGGTNSYVKYVHFLHPLYAWDGSWIREIFSLMREVNNHFTWLAAV